MTYFDPDVYDPEKLVGDEKRVMAGYDICMDTAVDAFMNYIDLVRHENPDTWGNLLGEYAEQIRDQIMDYLQGTRVQLTCSLMENNLELYGEDENGHCKADDILQAESEQSE